MTAIRDQAANQSSTSGGTSEQCSSTSEQCHAAQYIKQCRTGRCFRLGAAQPMWSCCAIARRSVTSGGSSTIAQQEASPGCLCEGAEKCCNSPPMKCSHSPYRHPLPLHPIAHSLCQSLCPPPPHFHCAHTGTPPQRHSHLFQRPLKALHLIIDAVALLSQQV